MEETRLLKAYRDPPLRLTHLPRLENITPIIHDMGVGFDRLLQSFSIRLDPEICPHVMMGLRGMLKKSKSHGVGESLRA